MSENNGEVGSAAFSAASETTDGSGESTPKHSLAIDMLKERLAITERAIENREILLLSGRKAEKQIKDAIAELNAERKHYLEALEVLDDTST